MRECCASCGHYDDGRCWTDDSPFNGEKTKWTDSCDAWEEVEVEPQCQTCSFWIMYRRQRCCANSPDMMLMKPTECCADWQELGSVWRPMERPE